jgi:hypothetical protein
MAAAAGEREEARVSGRIALGGAWVAALGAYAAVAGWLFAHPPMLSSDDALFFLRGLTRFSILDFSPQFPGYPGFIAMGRLLLPIAGSPLAALGGLTTLLALSLPPLAALIVWRNGDAWRALGAFVLALAMPLLPDLALSLLSDGAGIAFLLLCLSLLPRCDQAVRGWPALFAGVALGWAAACRPSDAVLLAGAAAGALVAAPRLFWPALGGFLLVAVPALAAMVVLEPLYFSEALRFTEGHALIWGNTPFAIGGTGGNWLDALASMRDGLLLAVLLGAGVIVAAPRLRVGPPVLSAATLAVVAHAIWIVAFQNPDSLRHLSPIFVLGPLVLILSCAAWPRTAVVGVIACLILELGAGLPLLDPAVDARPPPIAAETWLRAQPPGAVLATNDGVFLLRAGLPDTHVYDMHYPADARLGLELAAGPAYRLTSTPIPARTPVMTFPGRFAGESTLWLYRVAKAG